MNHIQHILVIKLFLLSIFVAATAQGNNLSSAEGEQALIEEFNLLAASNQQKALVRDAARDLGVLQDIMVLKSKSFFDAHVGTTESGRVFMGLCGTNDFEYNLITVYHELAHLINNDTVAKNQVQNGEKTSAFFLDSPEFKNDLDEIENYRCFAKNAFDQSTIIGRRINKILKEYDTFWIVPEDEGTYMDMLFLRATELRADLLACKKLYEMNNIVPILRFIDLYSNQTGYWGIQAIEDEYPHPSAFERALVMSGFLVSKEIDVNEVFKIWYDEGECSSYLELGNERNT